MIGLLWFLFIKKISKQKHYFLSLTAGLLLFMAIDSIEKAVDASTENLAQSCNDSLVIATVIVLSFLALYYSGNKIVQKANSSKFSKPVAITLMISIGIDLHNL